ncbi:MAG: hypothetical protein ABIC04_02465 [Nanoarchaeota archaeon]
MAQITDIGDDNYLLPRIYHEAECGNPKYAPILKQHSSDIAFKLTKLKMKISDRDEFVIYQNVKKRAKDVNILYLGGFHDISKFENDPFFETFSVRA